MTDEKGQSRVDLEPAVEREPGVGALVTAGVDVYASLDKDQVPDVVKAFLANRSVIYDNLKNKVTAWPKFLFDAGLDISLKAIMRAGMPVMKQHIKVQYHGADMYVIAGERHPFFLYYVASINVFAYTCEGLDGHWHAKMSFHVDRTAYADAVAKLGAGNLPTTGDVTGITDQFLNLQGRPTR